MRLTGSRGRKDGCFGHAGGEVVVEIAGVEGIVGAGVDEIDIQVVILLVVSFCCSLS